MSNHNEQPGQEQRDHAQRCRRITAIVILCLIVATVDIYGPTCFFSFLSWDDPYHIIHNPRFIRADGPDIAYFWRNYAFALYRPLIYTIWGLTARFAQLPEPVTQPGLGEVGFDAGVFHGLNAVAHTINVLLVFLILRRLLAGSYGALTATLAAGAGAMLFCVHPVQAEGVAWVTGGNAAIFGCFGLACLHQYVAFAQSSRDGRRRRAAAHYIAATVYYILAILTYPVAVALPFAAWALDRWAIGRPARWGLLAALPWIILAGPATFVTMAVRHPESVPVHVENWQRLVVAGDAYAFYLGKLLWPLHLGPDYGRKPDVVLSHWWGYATWLIPVALKLVLWRLRRRDPVPFAALAVFLILLLPVAGLITNAFQIYSTTADRYLYTPMLGVSLGFAWALAAAARQGGAVLRGAAVGAVAVLLSCGVLAVRHVQDFHDNVRFYTHAMQVNPKCWMAYHNLGLHWVSVEQYDTAIPLLRKAIDLNRPYPAGRRDLGNTLAMAGRHAEAVEQFQEVLRYVPNNAEVEDKLACSLAKTGRIDEAVIHLRRAIALKPDLTEAHYNLGAILFGRGKRAEAAAEFRAVLKSDPKNESARQSLARALGTKGSERP